MPTRECHTAANRAMLATIAAAPQAKIRNDKVSEALSALESITGCRIMSASSGAVDLENHSQRPPPTFLTYTPAPLATPPSPSTPGAQGLSLSMVRCAPRLPPSLSLCPLYTWSIMPPRLPPSLSFPALLLPRHPQHEMPQGVTARWRPGPLLRFQSLASSPTFPCYVRSVTVVMCERWCSVAVFLTQLRAYHCS